MKLLRLGLAVLAVVVLASTLVAPVIAAGPSVTPLPPNTVHIWAFYDKYWYDYGWPRGWKGPDSVWDGVYLSDGPWEWDYGGPQYRLTTALGKVISQGYPPENMQLTLPGDGMYWITLYPPEGDSPTGKPWRMSGYCRYPYRIYVKNGVVSVYRIDWKYTGDQVLAGIINER